MLPCVTASRDLVEDGPQEFRHESLVLPFNGGWLFVAPQWVGLHG